MKIFECSFSGVKEGAVVSQHHNLPAIVIGEEGRGREIGYVFVKGAKPKEKVLSGDLTFVNHVPVIMVGNENETKHDEVVVVARTKMGFRGHGYLRGRHLGWRLQYDFVGLDVSEVYPTEEAAEDAAIEERKRGKYLKVVAAFDKYEPPILAMGTVADGMAGNMGSATQVIFIAKEGEKFSLYRTGRLYGGEPIISFEVSGGRVSKTDTFEEIRNFLLDE